ncbi:MAG TPA: DUF2190 family protein [Sporosarcina psychrophila]|uniref:DUF2190 family protein n=1 Tax=Sporosarcina psychrophila TaxID=1476 RepID=A0A921G2B9_SPOPS|nr:DUF2190 family protein [Sporosarcina psychrophila]
MSKANYVQRGEVIDYKNVTASAIVANEVVELATRIGVAATEIPVGAVGGLNVMGVFDIPADTTEAFTAGQTVYYKGGKITSTEADAIPAGYAVVAKATAGAVARVKID